MAGTLAGFARTMDLRHSPIGKRVSKKPGVSKMVVLQSVLEVVSAALICLVVFMSAYAYVLRLGDQR